MRSTANHNCIAQLSLAGLAWVAALALLPSSAAASQGRAFDVPGTSITIYDPDYVLNNFTHRDGGDLFFTDREGHEWLLVEDPSSPVISNKGDGAFHPFDPFDVGAACEAVSFPLDRLDVEIFVLPFPRSDLLDCSADHGAIYLSPGMYEVHRAHAHMIVAHELGHCVQQELMPDRSRDLWARYRSMRGIADYSVYHAAAAHCMRPHEIFAEDFRWLFGDALSNYSGTIENRDLSLPDFVAGLADFMLSLAETRLARGGPSTPVELEVYNYPNPFSRTTTVSVRMDHSLSASGLSIGSTTARAMVFDVKGRTVKDFGSHYLGGNLHLQFNWDGTDNSGRQLASGVYFLRINLDRGMGGTVHKMLLKR